MDELKQAVIEVSFQEDNIQAIFDEQAKTIYVVCKRVAENLGVSWSSQLQKLKGKQFQRFTNHVDIDTVQGAREMLCISTKGLVLWLANISLESVGEDVQDKLMRYQDEAAEVLNEYFLGGGVVVNPRNQAAAQVEALHQLIDIAWGAKEVAGEAKEVANLALFKVGEIERDRYDERVARQKNRQRKFTSYDVNDQRIRGAIWNACSGACMRCGKSIALMANAKNPMNVDEVQPCVDGQNRRPDNVQALCVGCNQWRKHQPYWQETDYRRKHPEFVAAMRRLHSEFFPGELFSLPDIEAHIRDSGMIFRDTTEGF